MQQETKKLDTLSSLTVTYALRYKDHRSDVFHAMHSEKDANGGGDARDSQLRNEVVLRFWIAAWLGTVGAGIAFGLVAVLMLQKDVGTTLRLAVIAIAIGGANAMILGAPAIGVACAISLAARCPDSLSGAAAGGAVAGIVGVRLVVPFIDYMVLAAGMGAGGASLLAWRVRRLYYSRAGASEPKRTVRYLLLSNVFFALVYGALSIAVHR